MVKILIVEKDVKFRQKIINELSRTNENIKFCGIATNLSEFYDSIKEYSFDILLINLEILKNIELVYLEKFNKSIIALCSKHSTINDVLDIPLVYDFVTKSNNIDILNKKINELLKYKDSNEIKNLISKELNYLGYNPSHKGYQYLLETIYILNNLDNYFDDNLSKDIYPMVAKKFKTTPLNVKYNIRNATEAMCYYCKQSKLQQYLGIDFEEKPKVKAIIFTIENNIQKKIYS